MHKKSTELNTIAIGNRSNNAENNRTRKTEERIQTRQKGGKRKD